MTADRWTLMLLALAGKPMPKLPRIRGRVHKAPEGEAIDQRRKSYERAAAFTATVAPGWRGWRP